MTTIDLYKYIDFRKMFDDLYNESESIYIEYEGDNPNYALLNLFKMVQYNDYHIIHDECQFTDTEIIFVFEYNCDNSDDETVPDYVFVYSRVDEDFVDAEYNE